MANVGAFKNLGQNDIVSTRTLLHEAIPLTGTIVSGTYNDDNIKFHSHGMFQTVYDYPYLSSSANHIFDLTFGYSANSSLYDTADQQYKKKKNVYNQMSQILVGYDHTGSVLEFDEDGNILAGGAKIRESFIIPFSRLLVKDEIKKQTFSMELGVHHSYTGSVFSQRVLITDSGSKENYFVNSPAGEYGILYATASSGAGTANPTFELLKSNGQLPVGLIYYQAGIVVLSANVFNDNAAGGIIHDSTGSCKFKNSNGNVTSSITNIINDSTIQVITDNFRHRLYNLSFNNTTELNSTIYFCRANHNEFNYSTNPSYLNNSKIIVKEDNPNSDPISYITTIGLYSPNNELLAVSKLSEPLKKTPSTEFTLRVRLDY